MASKSEVGHARNVARFQQLISRCRAYGPDYDPAIPELTIAALETLLLQSRASLTDLTTSVTEFNNATNARRAAFQDIKRLSTRLFNWIAAAGIDEFTLNNARTINRKIQGARAPKRKRITMEPPSFPPTMASLDAYNEELRRAGLPPISTDEERQISVSQQSYDQLAYNFERLIIMAGSIPSYTPNVQTLQIANLQTKHATLLALTEALDNTYAATAMARNRRNQTLYADNVSLYNIAMRVKKYVKSIYGAKQDSPYRFISGIRFTKPRLRKQKTKTNPNTLTRQTNTSPENNTSSLRFKELEEKLVSLKQEIAILQAQKLAEEQEENQKQKFKKMEALKEEELKQEVLNLQALKNDALLRKQANLENLKQEAQTPKPPCNDDNDDENKSATPDENKTTDTTEGE